MRPEPGTHALLRIAAAEVLQCDTHLPQWVAQELRRAPWVVVRRASVREGLIPIGVRGAARSMRFAAWLPPGEVREALSPRELAARRGWRAHPRAAQVPALAALGRVEECLQRAGLASFWGPTGSVGFELASGCATATPHSDLDLMLHADAPLASEAAAAVLSEFLSLPARVDVLLETPYGAVALAEYVSAPRPILLRTATGVRLSSDPWAPAAAAA
jgi:phosphoribosyl-dephospho-CoA transferase